MRTTDSQQRTTLWVTFIVIAMVFFHYVGVLSPVEGLVRKTLQPLGRTILSLMRRSSIPGGTIEVELNSRVRELEARIAALSVENVQLRRSLDAAIEVSEQKAFLRERKLDGIPGRIFARSPDPSSEYVVIDVGAEDGVAVGTPAIVKDGIVVGIVTSVETESARVLLSTDNRSSFTAVVVGQPTAQGVVSGTRGLALRMELIPQSENIDVGKLITTSGLDPNVPPGLILGEIERVERQEGALFQSSSLRPLYTAARLDAITILTKEAS